MTAPVALGMRNFDGSHGGRRILCIPYSAVYLDEDGDGIGGDMR